MAKKPERFVRTLCEGNGLTAPQRELWVDSKTGVTYFFIRAGEGAGLTPLLDAMGKPVLSAVPRED